jgi:hypothetical protein
VIGLVFAGLAILLIAPIILLLTLIF